MSLADLSPLANHLWQSTLFVAVVWLLVLSLRRNQAECAPLAVAGRLREVSRPLCAPWSRSAVSSAGSRLPAVVQPDVTFVIDAISQPFSRPDVTAVSRSTAPSVAVLPILLFAIWFCGCALQLAGVVGTMAAFRGRRSGGIRQSKMAQCWTLFVVSKCVSGYVVRLRSCRRTPLSNQGCSASSSRCWCGREVSVSGSRIDSLKRSSRTNCVTSAAATILR